MEGMGGLLQWAGWLTALGLGICGYCFTILGWHIRGKQAKELAKKREIHEAMDRVFESLNELEDAAYSFWSDAESQLRSDQLILLSRRCVIRLNQLKQLQDFRYPVHEIAEMRRQATLDAESRAKPLRDGSMRLRRLSRAIESIVQSEVLRKTWD